MSTQKMTNEAATRIEKSTAQNGGDPTSSDFAVRAREAADRNENNKGKKAPSGMAMEDDDVFRTKAQSSQARSGGEMGSSGFPARTQSAVTNDNAKGSTGRSGFGVSATSRTSATQQK
ncbi:hypothetical protein E4U17_000363 [Claviceps sp. LM77 group G4]|nr:hypothetical protein E4U17_000363 [Claviceps sp. LM77 group G4]KAG6052813.1 hypothetical protein E4U33_000386 [Claviceps sp. LM78 group G4]KAG6068826.1 hypothetical protein E4U16_007876 [Claviceps sp. LM84 group G4]